MPQGDGIPLADAIDELRRELSNALERGRGQAVQFELGTVTMEFEVGITKAVEGKAGAKFWVVSLGGSSSREASSTHRITMELTPVVDGRAKPLISDRRKQEGD
jgi:hypothetical protein